MVMRMVMLHSRLLRRLSINVQTGHSIFVVVGGGEEFVIVLPETSLEGAITIANHVLQAVRNIKLNFGSDQHPGISVSVGIASMIVTEKNVTDELLDKADKAMYVAKQAGRDQYSIYNEQPISH